MGTTRRGFLGRAAAASAALVVGPRIKTGLAGLEVAEVEAVEPIVADTYTYVGGPASFATYSAALKQVWTEDSLMKQLYEGDTLLDKIELRRPPA